MLGIARRAGFVVLGTRAVRGALRSGRIHLLVVAKDASGNALSRLGSEARKVPRMRLGTRDMLGKAVGRGEVVVVGIIDSDFASRLVQENETQDAD